MRGSGVVTWKDLLFLLGTFILAVGTVNFYVIQRAEAQVATLQGEVRQNKMEADAGVTEVRKDVQALYKFMVTSQRQPRLEEK